MKTGPRPKSMSERKKLGARDTKPLVVSYVVPEDIPIPMPKVELGAVALAEWQNLWTHCPYLDRFKDHEIVIRYCRLIAELYRLHETVRVEGEVSHGYNNQPRPHPLFARIGVIERELRALEDRLALNPIERQRVSFEEVKKTSKLDELIARNNARRESFKQANQKSWQND